MEKFRYLFAQAEIVFWKVVVRLMKNQHLCRWPFTARDITIVAAILLVVLVWFPINRIMASIRHDSSQLGFSSEAGSHNYINKMMNSNQINYLIILVDSLENEKPALKGVWLAGHINSLPEVVFLPLYPSNREIDSQNYEGLFELTSRQQPTQTFLKFLHTKEISWSHYIILDEMSLVEAASLMTRSSIESQALFSNMDIMEMLQETNAPDVKIKAQARLANSLCQMAPDLVRHADPAVIWGLMTQRMRSDIELDNVIMAHQSLSIPGETPVCKFPTLRELTFHIEMH